MSFKQESVHSEYLSTKRKFDAQRTPLQKFADWLTKSFGSVGVLVFHVLWFTIWIIINLGLTPIKPFDPYPFGFLTLVVSLEAIFFSIIILISENREQKINDFREELSLALLKVVEKHLIKIEQKIEHSKKPTTHIDAEIRNLEVQVEEEVSEE